MSGLERYAWQTAALVAVVFGLYFRFKGFNTWPLADDEYFVFRSAQFVLQSGLPEFPCGGYYTRGLLYQLFTIPLLQLNFSPESSLRLISIVSSLLVLPAAYLLSRSIAGYRFAAVVVIVLCLSAWEVEMARFGRMYAPFQAVFMWYIYHAYRLIADGDFKRWRWMLGLSVAGPLIWEGGIVLALCNFLPLILDRRNWMPRHLLGAASILIAAAGFLLVNFRYAGSAPFESATTAADPGASGAGAIGQFISALPAFFQIPEFAVVAGVIVAVLLIATIRILSRRGLTLQEGVVVIAVILCISAAQLLLASFIFVSALLADWVGRQTIRKYGIRALIVIVGLASLAWILLAALSDVPPSITTRLRSLVGFPDVLYMLVYPWLASLPVMSTILALTSAATFIAVIRRPSDEYKGVRLLLLIVLASIFLVSIVPTLYRETRYSFFVYPLLLALSGVAFNNTSLRPSASHFRRVASIVPVLLLLIFALSADFDIKHMMHIDGYTANFRVGYSDQKARHYYIRTDYRSAADFINTNATFSDTVVVTAVALTQYVREPDYVFMSRADPRARGQICPDGKHERWSGISLIGSVNELKRTIAATDAGSVWVVVDMHLAALAEWQELLRETGNRTPMYTSADDRIAIHRF